MISSMCASFNNSTRWLTSISFTGGNKAETAGSKGSIRPQCSSILSPPATVAGRLDGRSKHDRSSAYC